MKLAFYSALLVGTSLLCSASAQSSTANRPSDGRVNVEFFNQPECKFILASANFGSSARESELKCENILSQNGNFVNYWVKSVRVAGICSNVQSFDTLAKSCLRFQ